MIPVTALLVANLRVAPCSWEATTASEGLVGCVDGSTCSLASDDGWACCGDGKLAKCPQNHHACNNPTAGVDFSCHKDCADHGGTKVCGEDGVPSCMVGHAVHGETCVGTAVRVGFACTPTCRHPFSPIPAKLECTSPDEELAFACVHPTKRELPPEPAEWRYFPRERGPEGDAADAESAEAEAAPSEAKTVDEAEPAELAPLPTKWFADERRCHDLCPNDEAWYVVHAVQFPPNVSRPNGTHVRVPPGDPRELDCMWMQSHAPESCELWLADASGWAARDACCVCGGGADVDAPCSVHPGRANQPGLANVTGS